MKEQVEDILPGFLLALFMGGLVFFSGWILPVNYLPKLVIQLFLGVIIVLTLGEMFKFGPYIEIKEIVTTNVFRKNNAR